MIVADPRPDTRPEWLDLTEDEAIAELRRGEESPYWEEFRDDPVVWADCPRHSQVVVRAEGICDECGYDFTSSHAPQIDNYRDVVA